MPVGVFQGDPTRPLVGANSPFFDSVAEAALSAVPYPFAVIHIAGVGEFMRSPVAPTQAYTPAAFQSGDGAWWIPSPVMAQAGSVLNIMGAVIGDSRCAYGADPLGTTNQGFQFWTQGRTKGLVSFPGRFNFALAGDTSVNTSVAPATDKPGILSRLPALLACSASFAVGLWSTNDRKSTTPVLSFADSKAAWEAVISAWTATGRPFIIIAEVPRGGSVQSGNRLETVKALPEHIQMHRWLLAQQGRPLVEVIDVWPTMAVKGSTTGDAISTYFYDDLHWNYLGADVVATLMTPRLQKYFGTAPRSVIADSASDVYGSFNLLGNQITNPFFTGTGGSATTGVLGDIPDGYTASQTPGLGCTVTPGQTLGAFNDWCKIDYAGTGSTTLPSFTLQFNLTAANFPVGSWSYSAVDMVVLADSSNFTGPGLYTRFVTPGGVLLPGMGSVANGAGYWPATEVAFPLIGEAYQLQVTPSQARWQFQAFSRMNELVSASIYLRASRTAQLPAPVYA